MYGYTTSTRTPISGYLKVSNICTDLSRVTTELTIKEDKCCCPFIRDIYITILAPDIQIFYGAINQMNHYKVDKYYGYHYVIHWIDGDLSSG